MARTRVVIGGVADEETGLAAAEAGADAVGFVFAPGSARRMDPEDAWEVVGLLPPFVGSVAVVRDLKVEGFSDLEEVCPTTVTVFDGEEPEPVLRQCGPGVIKTVRADVAGWAEKMARLEMIEEVDGVLLRLGGALPASDEEIRRVAEGVREFQKALLVAMGAKPTEEEVARVIGALRPYAVMMELEGAPGGEEDLRAAEAFMEMVRRADAR